MPPTPAYPATPAPDPPALLVVPVLQTPEGLPAHRGDDRHHQDHLGDHHGGRGVEQAERPQRTGARQRQVDQQSDHHRRQAHQRIQGDQRRAPAREPEHRQGRSERQADRGGGQNRAEADAQRQPDDLHQVRVEADHEPERRAERCTEILHADDPPSGGI